VRADAGVRACSVSLAAAAFYAEAFREAGKFGCAGFLRIRTGLTPADPALGPLLAPSSRLLNSTFWLPASEFRFQIPI
jgi:hypothetical protein